MKIIIPSLLIILLFSCCTDRYEKIEENQKRFDEMYHESLREHVLFQMSTTGFFEAFERGDVKEAQRYKDSCATHLKRLTKCRDSCIFIHNQLIKMRKDSYHSFF